MGLGRFVTAAAIVAMVGMSGAPFLQAGTIVREKGRTFIVDQRGERWEVTQAQSLGFVPEGFQYGIGRNAFTPLDDSRVQKEDEQIPGSTRVIGVKNGSSPRAFSVPTLWSHEVANSNLGGKPVAVGY
jgi:hypothetical protein